MLIFIIILVAIHVACFNKYKLYKNIANCKLKKSQNSLSCGTLTCSDSGEYNFYFISDSFLNMIGYSKKDIKSKFNNSLLGSVHPDDRQAVAKQLDSRNFISKLEYRIKTGYGNTIWVFNKCIHSTKDKPYLYCICTDITESKKAYQNLKFNYEKLKTAVSRTSNIIFEYNAVSGDIHFITKTNSYYGLPEFIEHGPVYFVNKGIVCKEYTQRFLDCFSSMSNPQTKMISMILKLKRADGKLIWNKLTLSSIKNPINNSISSIGTLEDITQAKEAQLQHKREEKYRAAMVSDAIATYEINLSANHFIKIYNTDKNISLNISHYSYTNLLKKLCDKLIYPEDKEHYLNIYNKDNLIKAFKKGRLILYNEYRQLDKSGKAFWVSCTANLLSDPENDDIKAFLYIKNIDTQKRKELAIKYYSERDPLTDLYNRKAAQNLILEYLKNSDTEKNKNAFLSFDLDGFKFVNDRYGHMSGDYLLSNVAECLKSVFHKNDVIARMGGDEFIVFIKNVESRTDILAKSLEACVSIKKLFINNKGSENISASVGIAISPLHGDNFEELYRKSDKALYFAKNAGKDRCVFYDPDME